MRKDLPYDFSVPSSWYEGCYFDKGNTLGSTRPFTLLHEEKSERAVLVIHGFTGYPGEMVRPAEDLFLEGFDVFVPRLPGHGTTGDDFLSTSSKDWVKCAENALSYLLERYKKVSVVGHSMGGAIAALLLERHPEIEKGVLCCPGLELKGMGGVASLMLSLISLFKKRIPKAWQSDSRYHMHYEGAPCDDEAIGNEYWKYLYPRQIVSLVKLAKKTKKNISSISSPVLFIGAGDDALTVPESVDTFSSMVGEKAKSIIVSGATHYVYYDISPEAEEKAVSATLDFLK